MTTPSTAICVDCSRRSYLHNFASQPEMSKMRLRGETRSTSSWVVWRALPQPLRPETRSTLNSQYLQYRASSSSGSFAYSWSNLLHLILLHRCVVPRVRVTLTILAILNFHMSQSARLGRRSSRPMGPNSVKARTCASAAVAESAITLVSRL